MSYNVMIKTFYKIGKTFTSVHRRFRGTIPYSWVLIKQIYGSADHISNIETYIHAQFKHHKHKPSIPFNGSTECFSVSIKEQLNDINKGTTSNC
jgi:hypothetical protein